MDMTKKAVVEPPKNVPPPVKAQAPHEHKAQADAAKPCCGSQPKAKA